MFLRFLHWAASHGWVYDRIQIASGARQVYARVARHLPSASGPEFVLDVGGGTGGVRSAWRSPCRYLCIDLEMPKLRTLVEKHPDSLPVLADAARMPLPDNCVETIVCTAVAHHLPPEVLDGVLRECARVLRPDGRFVFLDALHRPDRWISRFMWRFDRGANPYAEDALRSALSRRFRIASEERFAVYHEYLLAVLRKPPAVRYSECSPSDQ